MAELPHFRARKVTENHSTSRKRRNPKSGDNHRTTQTKGDGVLCVSRGFFSGLLIVRAILVLLFFFFKIRTQ